MGIDHGIVRLGATLPQAPTITLIGIETHL